MKKEGRSIDIIIPAYNEAGRIIPTLEAYSQYILEAGLHAKINVIVNGSKDNTEAVVKEYAKQYPDLIQYHVVSERIGKGGAVVYGMARSQADIIGFVDADNSITPDWFDNLVQPLLQYPDLDGTISSRALPDSILENRNRRRIAISKGFNWGVNFLFNLGFKDTQCGAKVFRKKVIDTVLPRLHLANMAFDVDFLYNIRKANFLIQEIPIHWIDVQGLTSKNPTRIALNMGLSCIELRLIHSPFSFLRFLLYPFWMLLLKPADRPLRFLQKKIVFPHNGQ